MIQIEPYQTNWQVEFNHLKEVLSSFIPEKYPILHVGSTSVPGMWAKPIIDIIIVYNIDEDIPMLINLLETKGYLYEGIKGIQHRHAFKKSTKEIPINNNYKWVFETHLYAVLKDSIPYQNMIGIQSMLLTHPEYIKEYSALKQELVKQTTSRMDYTRRKTTFIIGLLKEYGLDTDTLHQIQSENEN